MLKKKYFCLAAFCILSLYLFSPAFGWLDGWTYWRAIEIDNDDLAVSNYSLLLNVSHADNMLDNFADIRFSDSDESTELSYWIENQVDGEYADVWVKIPELGNITNTTIYMFYGNTTAVESESTIYGKYVFFDNFTGTSLDSTKWPSITGTNYAVADGMLSITSSTVAGDTQLSATGTLFSGNTIFESRVQSNNADAQSTYFIGAHHIFDSTDDSFVIYDVKDSFNRLNFFIRNDDSAFQNEYSVSDITQWHTYSMIWKPGHVIYFQDSTQYEDFTTLIPDESLYLVLKGYGSRTYSGRTLYYDWVGARTYLTTEPTYSIDGLGEASIMIQIIYPLYSKRYLTSNQTIIFNVVSETDETFNISAYMDDVIIYENNSYLNATNITIDHFFNTTGAHTLKVAAEGTETSTYITRTVTLDLYDFAVTFGGYGTYDATNYADTITYNYSARCGVLGETAYINITANGERIGGHAVTCDNTTYSYSDSYQHTTEENITLDIGLWTFDNSSIDTIESINYTSDLTTPTTTITYDFDYGFLTDNGDSADYTATDNISPVTFCNITFPGNETDNITYHNETQTYNFNLTDGTLNFILSCADVAGHTHTATRTETIRYNHFILVDEETGAIFSDYGNMTTLRAISENNDTVFDFLDGNKTEIYYLTNESDTIRIEKEYKDIDDTLFTDLELDLLSDDARVCVAKPQQFYEIIFYSTATKEIAVINNLANCYVLAGSTRYAYSDAMSAKAFTIKALYYLYTFDDGEQVFLSAVDGSSAISTNLDVLEFSKNTYDLGVTTDDISISRAGSVDGTLNSTIKIYYYNMVGDNSALDVTILNGSINLFHTIITDTPNEFTLYVDTSDLGIDDSTLLKFILTKTKTNGETDTDERLFTVSGHSGTLHPNVALIISFFLIFFSLTFTAYRYVFGYFGLIMTFTALAILTLCPATPIIRFMQAVELIVMVFIGLILKEENGGVM